MPADAPRVTVIATSYNQRDLIVGALDSVAAQTERDHQLIVTDDGSTDGSQAVIERWLAAHDPGGHLVASDANIGLPAILNRALPHIKGIYAVVLNGDDWMDPDRIAAQAAALDAAPPDVGVVYSDLRVVDEAGRPTGELFPPPDVERREGDVLLHIIEHPMIGMPSVMFRSGILEHIGPWDEELLADDFDFLLRVAAAGYQFRYVPGPFVSYRQHGSSLTGSRAAPLAAGRAHALHKLLGRDPVIDRAVVTRTEGLAVALHGLGHDRRETRKLLWFVLRRKPSRRVARVMVENMLHLAPGRLVSLRTSRRARRVR